MTFAADSGNFFDTPEVIAAWESWIVSCARIVWMHEFDEWLKINGKCYRNPHPENGP
jgi:hypothetical protein